MALTDTLRQLSMAANFRIGPEATLRRRPSVTALQGGFNRSTQHIRLPSDQAPLGPRLNQDAR